MAAFYPLPPLCQRQKFRHASELICRVTALFLRASIHVSQGLHEQARQELERLLRADPNFSEAHAALATAYYRLKRTADGDRETAEARRVREDAQRRVEEQRKPMPEKP